MTISRLLCALLCVLCIGPAVSRPGPALAGDTIRVLAPQDQARLTSPSIHLVYSTPSPTPARLELDGTPLPSAPRTTHENDRYVHHLRVPLEPGEHRLRLQDAAGALPERALTVTRVGASRQGTAAAPPLTPFHTARGEALCGDCHRLPDDHDTSPEGAATTAQICATCHTEVGRGSQIHGPVAVGACFTCHDTAYGPARFSPRPVLETCGSCHVDVVAAVLGGEAFAHGPAAAGACTICHDPHGGESAALLRTPLPQLCFACHGETVARPVRETLHGKLPCTGCHGPHGGATQALTATPGNAFCSGCHRSVDPSAPGHPLMGHPVASVEAVRIGNGPMRCESCHPPHGTADVSKLDIAANETAQRRFCVGCHPA